MTGVGVMSVMSSGWWIAIELVLHVDHPRAAECLVEHVEVATHRGGMALIGQSEHVLDDPMMREAHAEGESATGDRLDRQRLLGQHDGMAGLDRYDGRADLYA